VRFHTSWTRLCPSPILFAKGCFWRIVERAKLTAGDPSEDCTGYLSVDPAIPVFLTAPSMLDRIVRALLVLLLQFFLCGQCEGGDVVVSGIYSNMKTDSGAGDVSGMEVFIVGSRSGYQAVVQCSPGEPYEPFIAPLQMVGNKIRIAVPPRLALICGARTILGEILKDGLAVDLRESKVHMKLPRGSSFWIE
jgi:hypothetical protein